MTWIRRVVERHHSPSVHMYKIEKKIISKTAMAYVFGSRENVFI